MLRRRTACLRGAALGRRGPACGEPGFGAEPEKKMSQEYVIVLTTLPADADGDAFGRTLVEERLAACVNLLPAMESFYRWEGQVERDAERQVIIKTQRDRVAALWDRIRELHPYETPEFVVLTISDGSEAYLRWIGESTG
jgi:periplasmic divalent cation tolerance protein